MYKYRTESPVLAAAARQATSEMTGPVGFFGDAKDKRFLFFY